jgi:phosphatidylglycerophosphate synthase
MFDEPFRARFQPMVRPLVRRLASLGVTPDRVTVAAFVLGIAAAALLAGGRTDAALAVWLVSRVGDGLDGALAREMDRSTPFGGYLDITLDMAAYAAMVVGFAALYPRLGVAWTMVLLGYVVVITTTLALSDAAGVLGRQVSGTDRTFQFTPGFAEAGETNAMYVLWVLFPRYLEPLVWIWVALLAATSVQRTLVASRALRPPPAA